MNIHIDFAKSKNRWNVFETMYTCIGCGRCSEDKQARCQNRIRVLKRLLKKQHEFNQWDDNPEGRAIQEKNIKFNIRYFKRKLRYYEKRVEGDK